MASMSHGVLSLVQALALLLLLLPGTTASSSIKVYARYADSSCSSTPQQLVFDGSSSSSSCTDSSTCASATTGATSYYLKQSCASSSSDLIATAKSLFTSSTKSVSYVIMEVYKADASASCAMLTSGIAFVADGTCVVTDNGVSSVTASVGADGSASIATFGGTTCSGTATKSNVIPRSAITANTCVNSVFKFYTSDVTTNTTSTSTATSAAAPLRNSSLTILSWLLFTAATALVTA
uniref:Uncharacterized protein n=1 Tax=Globisporangium ultimum (strain ATCC 200006 / CBS 805.95 / DAOM BR144) TaxID=431595 RepID=K3WN41_GLOUD